MLYVLLYILYCLCCILSLVAIPDELESLNVDEDEKEEDSAGAEDMEEMPAEITDLSDLVFTKHSGERDWPLPCSANMGHWSFLYIVLLTLSQATNFRLFQTEKGFRRQF